MSLRPTLSACSGNVLWCYVQNLVSHMLVLDVDDRFSAAEVLSHPWVSVGAVCTVLFVLLMGVKMKVTGLQRLKTHLVDYLNVDFLYMSLNLLNLFEGKCCQRRRFAQWINQSDIFKLFKVCQEKSTRSRCYSGKLTKLIIIQLSSPQNLVCRWLANVLSFSVNGTG